MLLAWPSALLRLLFGSQATGATDQIGRVAGIALISLGIACIPRREPILLAQVAGMLTYNVLVAIYLIIVGLQASSVGPLLWPAAALHAGVTLGMVVLWNKQPSHS